MTEIRTPRLLLRPWSDDDLVPLSEINADREVMRWVGDGSVRDLDETAEDIERYDEEWDDEGFGVFAVELLGSGELIGLAGLSVPDALPELMSEVEISWRLGRQFWGQGYASEAAHAVLEFALQDRGLDRVVAVAHISDRASENVIGKLGMTAEREFDHPVFRVPLRVYAIDLTEYQA
ncbi:GNAT family N-acetyltransferase [Streptomyces wedmorensis]